MTQLFSYHERIHVPEGSNNYVTEEMILRPRALMEDQNNSRSSIRIHVSKPLRYLPRDTEDIAKEVWIVCTLQTEGNEHTLGQLCRQPTSAVFILLP